MIKFIFILISSLSLLSCSKKNSTHNVIINNYNHTANPDKIFFNYQISGNSCGLNWHVIENKLDQKWSIKLVEDINKKFYCKSFSEERPKHLAVLKEIFKHHDSQLLTSIAIPSLSILQPDLSWNIQLSQKAGTSLSWKKYLKSNEIGVDLLDAKNILKEIINKNDIDHELKKLFAEVGIEIKLHTTQKVRSISSKSKYYKKLPEQTRSIKRILFDADYFWYKVN